MDHIETKILNSYTIQVLPGILSGPKPYRIQSN